MENELSDFLSSSVQTPGYAPAPSHLLFNNSEIIRREKERFSSLNAILAELLYFSGRGAWSQWEIEEKQQDTLTWHPFGDWWLGHSWRPGYKCLLWLLCTSEAEWSPNRQDKRHGVKKISTPVWRIFKQHIIYTGSTSFSFPKTTSLILTEC